MRLRIVFAKQGPLRYVGHLDLQKIWERTIRRAGLPLAYTQGFHPQPRLQIASALPLGFTSRAEIVDIFLTHPIELASLKERLQAASPSGLEILEIKEVEMNEPALQSQLRAAEYTITLPQPAPLADQELGRRVAALLQATSLPRQRRGKEYDLRPLIEDLRLLEGGCLFMRLSAREGATGRPEEVLDALGIPWEEAQIERIRLIFAGETS
ncbi:MAG: TIGR03936 family radical SAM-associated protein [Anaerolineales bacterium]